MAASRRRRAPPFATACILFLTLSCISPEAEAFVTDATSSALFRGATSPGVLRIRPRWSAAAPPPYPSSYPPRPCPATRTAPALSASTSTSASSEGVDIRTSKRNLAGLQLVTLLRVSVPSVAAGILSTALFPLAASSLTGCGGRIPALVPPSGLSDAASAFVQQFLAVMGLLFSILMGQTYSFVYSQQEALYYALFNEVTEAKSLLEQVALVCQGRAMYPRILSSMKRYVDDDLKRGVRTDPAVLLSARPVDDPLEAIMYMTSVGVPGVVYETVRSLRQARAARLGALQRKVPPVHLALLWMLAGTMLLSFPLLGVGSVAAAAATSTTKAATATATATAAATTTRLAGAASFTKILPDLFCGYNFFTVEGLLFGLLAFGLVLSKRVVAELLRPAGGAYNVDQVLSVMVRGLDRELDERMKGQRGKGQKKSNAAK